MSTDSIVGAMVGMAMDRTQIGLQAAMVRQEVKADQELVALLANAAQAAPAPAPGTGLIVDKTA
ncbi:hypothetical protein [Phreatobacter sp. AB_2022a]|uniref:hypothetical protein n=1 Tax=Phreatobacter sp. AB_2022a TaxID=3003134 RepID=UPI0005720742|nr:hypothetical protein [Phreatobacter sp. AB_2022a]MCZ0737266.1 hypothetical protein [Phreatobacter sp. AB_2022a]CEJ10934.1 hypothetical protein BN1110_01220 [bacterium YEK0313]